MKEVFVRMPFGKYRNSELGEIPGSYLGWLLDEDVPRSAHLRQAIIDELDRRAYRKRHHSAPPPPPNTFSVPAQYRPVVEEIIHAGYRSASKKAHPDLGGTGEKFRLLHDAFQWLNKGIT